MTDSSEKVLALLPQLHSGSAKKARNSHFSRMFASIAYIGCQRQARADYWPATQLRQMNGPVSSLFCELALCAWPGFQAYLHANSDDTWRVAYRDWLESEACVRAQAHFPFRCNDLKFFNAISVLAMDEEQSPALANLLKMYLDSVLF